MTDSSSLDDFRKALGVRSDVLDLIERYERKLDLLHEDGVHEDEPGVATEVIPELLEDSKDVLREELYKNIRDIFVAPSDGDALTSRVYEEGLYHLLADKLNRNLGYYNALNRIQEEIASCNSALGDPSAIEMAVLPIQRLLHKLDEIDFIRNLGVSLGLNQRDLDLIVENSILHHFAPKKSEETFRKSER